MKQILILLVLGAFTLPTLAAATGRLQQEDNIREVVFRHLLDNNEYSLRGVFFEDYYFALGYRESKKPPDPSDLFKDILIDPSDRFMGRFSNLKTVHKASLSREKLFDEVRDRRTGKSGLLILVTDIVWISETEVRVRAGYRRASLGSAGFTYVVKFESGVWKIADRHQDYVS